MVGSIVDPSDSGPTPFSGPNSNNDRITSQKVTRMGVAVLESNLSTQDALTDGYRARGAGVEDIASEAEGDLIADDADPGPLGPAHAGSNRPSICKPTGLSHVFTHVLEDPNDDICKLTKVAKSRCMNRPRERSDGLRSLAAFGNLFPADHTHIDRRT